MNNRCKKLAMSTRATAYGLPKRAWLVLALAAVLALILIGFNQMGPHSSAADGTAAASPSQLERVRATEVLTHTLFLPLITHGPQPTLVVNPRERQASMDFFHQVYLASEGVSSGWTGNHATCDAGTTTEVFRAAVQLRINYFRAMAGLPGEVQLSDEYNRKAQQAALMMSANGQLSHSPPSSWLCYTEEGKEAAGSSNLFLGVYGPEAITGYMMDPGSGNYAAGHRRWILYPQTQAMGTGDIPPVDSYWASNALWVFDENMWAPRPTTREEYIAWPPPGYVPYQVVFARWSFAYAGADLSSATVEMSTAGHSLPVTVQPVVNGYGENTLVWEPDTSFSTPPPADTAYNVTVRHVGIEGAFRDFAYQVVIFEPDAAAGASFGRPDGVLGTPPRAP